jgi:uncharacterized protein YndB with AHSA1/START domain
MTHPIATTSEEMVAIERVFDAPRSAVFRAWTDPEELAAWYGPAHMDTPRERIRIDLRIGGRYELTMVRRDGAGEFSIGYEIVELSAPELLVLRSDPMPRAGARDSSLLRIELHEEGERTRMRLTDGPFPAEGARGAEAGWAAALDALDGRLRDR